jgi:DNA/RNA-binding domain of Phe-tRNA-synthetase-like protein
MLADVDTPGQQALTRVVELRRIRAEGMAAPVGAVNPYWGQLVLAAVWRTGYRQMLDDMLANSPARQAYLRRVARDRETPRRD